MASAYTVFTNGGQHVEPVMIRSVREPDGDAVRDAKGNVDNFPQQKNQVLDPRVAYVMTEMLEYTINNGTPAGPGGVRARGFTVPAAAKTGSSHDAWFAGYTSNLLCIVWVGYDDNTNVQLPGAALALPIWTEFMKRGTALPQYSDVKPFSSPQGVVRLVLDKATNQVATPACPDDYTSVFIDGTQPTQTCDQGAGEHGNLLQRVFGLENPKPPPAPAVSNPVSNTVSPGQVPAQQPGGYRPFGQPTPAPAQTTVTDKKKGFWHRFFGGSKNDNKDDNKDKKPAVPGPSQ
jgi:penicillin-binding protein 1B